MSEDYRVNRRSNGAVREAAERTKRFFGVDNVRPVNVIRCLEEGSVKTDYGRKQLVFVVVDDNKLPEADAKTEYEPGKVTITSRRSVHNQAALGDGRSRMTLSHELGHAVMHEGSPKHRGVDASGTTHLSRLAPSESAEHQAKVFAAAFLIHDEMAESLPSPEEISVEFGVSLEAAKICFSEIRKKVDRRESGKRVRQIAEAFRNSSPPPFGQGPKYVDGLCERCKKPRLIPLGSKYYCTECKTTSDRFQDGDY